MTDQADLPWSTPWKLNRCRAYLPRHAGSQYHGRCDLRRGHTCAHVLERGFDLQFFIVAATVCDHPQGIIGVAE